MCDSILQTHAYGERLFTEIPKLKKRPMTSYSHTDVRVELGASNTSDLAMDPVQATLESTCAVASPLLVVQGELLASY